MIPELVPTPANAGLEQVATTAVERRTLTCKDLLVGDTRVAAEAEAAKLFDEMLANTQVFMIYGTSALEGVNSLVDRLLNEVEPTKIPELQKLMEDLNDGMRDIRYKYDVSDPKVRDKFEKWKGGIWRFIGKSKSLVEMLMEDVTSIESQLDKIGKRLRDRQYQLQKNVVYYDALYEENEKEILKVIYAIGVMELIRDLAIERARAIPVGDASLGDRGGEEQASLVEFSSNMEAKIAEYKGRLFVAWATSPQVRMMRTLNVGLAMRINELLCVTIPTMRATILEWRLLMQTKDAAEMSKLVQDASNDWLKAYAAAGAAVVPMVAELVQTPTLLPQTVEAMAASILTQSEGIVRAMELGDQRRAELDKSMLAAKDVLDSSSRAITEAVVDRIVKQSEAKPLELEVATSVAS